MYDGVKSEVFAIQNKQSAYIYGANSNVYVSLLEHINISGGVTYTYGRINTDSVDYPLDHISPLYGRGSIKYFVNKFEAEIFMILCKYLTIFKLKFALKYLFSKF